jgi:hypothetical protein
LTPESLARFTSPAHEALQSRRTEEFLTWRIAQSPRATEHFVLEDANGSACAALARRVDDKSYRRLHLLALRHACDDATLSGFFRGVVRWALDNGIVHVWLVTGERIVLRAARPWLPIVRPARFAYHATRERDLDFLSGLQHWEAIDSDFDLEFA